MKKLIMIEVMVIDWCNIVTDNYVDYMTLKEKLMKKIDRSWAKEMIYDTYNDYVEGKLKIGQVIDKLLWR